MGPGIISNQHLHSLQLKLNYVFNFEYKYKLGDCVTFCERSKCKDLLKGKPYSKRWVGLRSY